LIHRKREIRFLFFLGFREREMLSFETRKLQNSEAFRFCFLLRSDGVFAQNIDDYFVNTRDFFTILTILICYFFTKKIAIIMN